MELLIAGGLQDIVEHSRQVDDGDFLPCEVEEGKLLQLVVRVESDVEAGVFVAAGVAHPHVEASIGEVIRWWRR